MEGVHWVDKNKNESKANFKPLPPPSNEQVKKCLKKIQTRVIKLLIKNGYLESDEKIAETHDTWNEEQQLLSEVFSASIQNVIALGERTGQGIKRMLDIVLRKGGPMELIPFNFLHWNSLKN